MTADILDRLRAMPPGSLVPVDWLLAELEAALVASANGAPAPVSPDRMLSAAEVGEMLGTTERWVYTHADQLGGKRLSRRCLRFPESAIRRRTERRP
jgi:predicted DNA-binding transcriptional regulator AlpA